MEQKIEQRTAQNDVGKLSMIFGILGFPAGMMVFMGFVFDVIAIVFGLVAVGKNVENKKMGALGIVLGIIDAIATLGLINYLK